MSEVVMQGRDFALGIFGSPAAFTITRGGRQVGRSGSWGVACRSGRRWIPAGDPRAVSASVARLTCGETMVDLSIESDRISIEAARPAVEIGICFQVDGSWFGQGTFFRQVWPLSKATYALDPFETADGGRNLQCPAWVTSSGMLIAAPGYQDLACSMNRPVRGEMRLWSKSGRLELLVRSGDGARDAMDSLLELGGRPTSRPPKAVFERPIWTTWAEFKTEISQGVVLEYARRVVEEGFPRSVLEIDAKWQREYGDTSFDEERFPDPAAMVGKLHEMGFAVTCWIPWMVDEPSENFADADLNGYFLKDPATNQTAIFPWFMNKTRGGALVDVANDHAYAWWLSRLKAMCAATGVDGFKFDAGEASFVGRDLRSKQIVPNLLSDRWSSMATEFAFSEARTGWWGQSSGVVMREWDKLTAWWDRDGLGAVIPQALTISLLGYPFVVPDMVGGNEYGNKCSAELMVRWAQVTAFMPVAQFSVAPWRWGAATTDLVRRTTQWRLDHAPLLDRLATLAVEQGTPMILPLFWLAPDDDRALRCGNEFLLGEDLLVAPVTKRRAVSRDVYLPPGEWVDRNRGDRIEGPVVLKEYPAPLDLLPCFGRSGTEFDAPIN